MAPPDKSRATAHRELAAKVSAAFQLRGFSVVQYGGATVEHYTGGGYRTGDVDLGFLSRAPSLEVKSEVMKQFGCERGVRLFWVGELAVDLGGVAELFNPKLVTIETPYGPLQLESPEESLVQRMLVSVYPQEQPDQKNAALLLMAQALAGNLELDWLEVERLAALPGFKVKELILPYRQEAARLLALISPPNSDESN